LAIEVADSSLERDLDIKRHLYAEVRIEEYWIVDCQASCIHVFRHPSQGDYQNHFTLSAPESISPLVAPEAILDLRDLFEGE
jgi:Uma2 family endonuclease